MDTKICLKVYIALLLTTYFFDCKQGCKVSFKQKMLFFFTQCPFKHFIIEIPAGKYVP